MPASRIESLDDVRAWIAEHDGRINAWWESQHQWNAREESRRLAREGELSDRIDRISDRVHSLERRVVYVAGVMSALGALGGNLILSTFGG